MKSIHIKLILFQCFGIFFLINGIQRIHVALQAEKYDCILHLESDCWDKYKPELVGDFMAERGYWPLYIYPFAIFLVALINWKSKKSGWNTAIVAILIFSLFPTGIFFEGFLNEKLNQFGGIFTEDFKNGFIISGTTFTLLGIFLLLLGWKKSFKNTDIQSSKN